MTLEERLRTLLHEAAKTIPVDEPASTLRPAEPARRLRPLIAFVAGAAAVAVLGLVVWLAPGSAPSQPLRLDTAESMSLEWNTMEFLPADFAAGPFAIGPQGAITKAARFQGALGDDTSLVFSSPDGVDWSRVDARGFGGQELVGHAGGYVSYGRYGGGGVTTTTAPPTEFPRPAVWTSADAAEWDVALLPLPSPDDAISEIVSYQMSGLAVAESEMVAVGIEFDEDLPDVEGDQIVPTRQVMWATNAAGEWELVDYPMERPTSVAAGPEGTIVTDATDSGTAIWKREGASWSQTGTIPEAEFVFSAVGNATGYLIARESVWFSPDGSTWTRVDGPVNVNTVEAGPSSYVALGHLDGEAAVWWSDNGIDWDLIGVGDDFGIEPDAFVSYVGVTDHAVLIAGQTANDLNEMPAVGVEGYVVVGTLEP